MVLRLNYETYSFYIAPCNGLQSAVAQYAADQTRKTRANPFSFRQVHWVLLRALHSTRDQWLYFEGQSIMVKCLADVSGLGLESTLC